MHQTRISEQLLAMVVSRRVIITRVLSRTNVIFRQRLQMNVAYENADLLLSWKVATKRVWRYQRGFRIRKSRDRQHNSQTKMEKRTNTDLQNTTQKTIGWGTRTLLSTGDEFRCSGRVGRSCSTSDTRRISVTLVTSGGVFINKLCQWICLKGTYI